jgi:putative tricarboxylic transport membrane protein
MQKADRITCGVLLVFSAYIIKTSLDYGMTRNNITGPGFIPFWVGVALALLAALLLLQTFRPADASESAADFDRESLMSCALYIGGSTAVVIATPFLGLMVPTGIAVCVFAKFKGDKSWKSSILLALGTAVGIFLLFDLALGVALPKGPFGF